MPLAEGERQPADHAEALELTALDRALQKLYRTRALVGNVPTGPATRRARTGAALIGFVRRSLFWLLPQIDAFHCAVIEFAECQAAFMVELRGYLADIDAELELIRRDLTRLEDGPETPGADAGEHSAGEVWLKLVRCQARVASVRQAIQASGRQQDPSDPV